MQLIVEICQKTWESVVTQASDQQQEKSEKKKMYKNSVIEKKNVYKYIILFGIRCNTMMIF